MIKLTSQFVRIERLLSAHYSRGYWYNIWSTIKIFLIALYHLLRIIDFFRTIVLWYYIPQRQKREEMTSNWIIYLVLKSTHQSYLDRFYQTALVSWIFLFKSYLSNPKKLLYFIVNRSLRRCDSFFLSACLF